MIIHEHKSSNSSSQGLSLSPTSLIWYLIFHVFYQMYFGIQVREHFSTVSLVEVGIHLAKVCWLKGVVFSTQECNGKWGITLIKTPLLRRASIKFSNSFQSSGQNWHKKSQISGFLVAIPIFCQMGEHFTESPLKRVNTSVNDPLNSSYFFFWLYKMML